MTTAPRLLGSRQSPGVASATGRGCGSSAPAGGVKRGRGRVTGTRLVRTQQIIAYAVGNPTATLQEIGDAFGCSRQYVQFVLARDKVRTETALRLRARIRAEARAATAREQLAARMSAKLTVFGVALALHQSGHTYEQIGNKLGLSTMGAWHRVQRALVLSNTIGATVGASEASVAGMSTSPKLAAGCRVQAGGAF